jgi:hypothetical protein
MPTQPRTTTPATPAMPGMPTQPRTTTPATPAMPGTTTPGMTTPGMTTPGMTTPGMAMPDMTMPSMPSPNGTTGTPPTLPMQLGTPMSSRSQYTTQPKGVFISNKEENDLLSSAKNSMYLQDPFVNPYNLPVGVPMMPLYGYDNTEDADKDWDYMKQMYPVIAKKILANIEDECDKLEYDGSCMFDEYPDRVYLSRIVDRIYDKAKYLEEDVNGTEISSTSEDNKEYKDEKINSNQYSYGRYYDRNRHSRNNWLRDLIEVLLFNEILNRRRRYRGRRRWF